MVVIAGAQDSVIAQNKLYTIPKGTKNVTLIYNVATAEYPKWVTEQSVYNDNWTLSLYSASGALFAISRQVNSQLYMAPTWLPNGTTGEISETIDVSSLTKDAAIKLVLYATSMNVGDSILPTTVSAMLIEPPLLEITDAKSDSISSSNNGNYYSIPGTGEANTMQRYFTLRVSKSETVSLKAVTVVVGGASDLMTVMDRKTIPSASDVQIVSDTPEEVTLKVRVTISDPVSVINGEPPPTRNLQYTFTVSGESENSTPLSSDKVVAERRALWRMAGVFPQGRYGARDSGGDDWGALGTYQWIQNNGGLLKEIDDISGEHGRDIGHSTHQYGTDIDMYHFYRFPGATSGGDNYARLRNAAIAAFGVLAADGTMLQNPPAAAQTAYTQLIAFVSETRTGLDQLAALGTVESLYYAIGSASGGLSNGWAKNLIESGSLTKGTQTLVVNNTTWSNTKMRYNATHHSHVHITLDRAQIGE